MQTRSPSQLARWASRLMALLALVNLVLVLVNTSFIPLRKYYLWLLPEFTRWYGSSVKGIEPEPLATDYLQTVDRLQAVGLASPEADALLQNLRDRSPTLLLENPFANQPELLATFQSRLRQRLEVPSTEAALQRFWQREYLTRAGEPEAIAFFNTEIRPLLAATYTRPLAANGRVSDRFWQLDLGFMALFGADLLVRLGHLRRRYPQASWLDVLLWRWYDLLLLLPVARWLRVIPTAVRLNQTGLLPLEPVRDRLSRGLVASVAVELTEVVVLRVVNQLQSLLRQGASSRLLRSPQWSQYIDLNGVNEIEAIAQQLLTLLAYRILPTVKPELEALLTYTLTCVLQQSPLYRGLGSLPGAPAWGDRLTQQLVTQTTDTAYSSLITALENPQGLALTRQLLARLAESLAQALTQGGTAEDLEKLLVAWLEELKINYVEQISELDLAFLQDQNQRKA